MVDSFPREERDALLARSRDLWARLYPESDPRPGDGESLLIREAYYQCLAEYGDRLPRVPMGQCPFTGDPLLRAIDPYGFDGYWWHVDPVVNVQEPRTSPMFQVLLGAVTLGRPAPTEAGDRVLPGPDVPFVIPRLLALPGMQAVIARVELATGDTAWPISYWSDQELSPGLLHQPWCRDMFWFLSESTGEEAWSISNAEWDFDLARWAADGKLSWLDLTAPSPQLQRTDLEFLAALPGERRPQQFAGGQRTYLELPDGSAMVPFGEPDLDEPPPITPEQIAAMEADHRKRNEK